MIELKSCPFCGSEQVEVRRIKDRWSVGCATTDCICQWWYSRQFNDKDKAIEAWNKRPIAEWADFVEGCRWRSADKELPTMDGEFIVSVKGVPFTFSAKFHPMSRLYLASESGWYGTFGPIKGDVIAWMPLPEPYKAKEENYD